ncbi:MAG: hypothetical protein DMF04_04680 [Verrucomicrobia bacterium]|nr:MAG: hypothetical protein DMF04_04680 [Verrucomicrobiota bacterium]
MIRRAFETAWKRRVLVLISLAAGAASVWIWRSTSSNTSQLATTPVFRSTEDRAANSAARTDADRPASGAPISAATPRAEGRSPGPATVDAKRVDQLGRALNSGPVDEQIEAINVFARVGTSEQKNAIVAKAKNRDANVAVRVAAVENIDWREHVDVVTDLIRSEPELGEATLYMGADKELPPEVVNRMAETAAPVFQTSADPSFQLAVLNFFIEHHLDGFADLVAKANTNRYSESEIEDLNQLIAMWNSEKGSGQEMQAPN